MAAANGPVPSDVFAELDANEQLRLELVDFSPEGRHGGMWG